MILKKISKPVLPKINFGLSLNSGLVFHVPFSEGNGNPLDISGNANDGTVVGSAPWAMNPYGWGMSFNGSSQSVTFENGAHSELTLQVFTYSALIYVPTAGTGNRTISAYFDIGNQVPQFRVDTADKLALISANIVEIGVSTSTVIKDTWFLATVTYNSSGVFNFYQDGTNIGSGTNLQTFDTNPDQIVLGQQNGGAKEWLNGSMAWFTAWNRALSSTEVALLAQNPFRIYAMPSAQNSLRPAIFKPGIAR